MFIEVFIKRPVLAMVCSIVVTLAGLICLPLLPIEYYPSVAPPTVTVQTNYTGASAEVVETSVTNLLEKEINGVKGMKYLSSTSSSDGSSVITVTFELGTDIDIAAVDVQNRASRVQGQLPQEVNQTGVIVDKSGNSGFVQFVSLTSENGEYDSVFLSNYTDLFVRDAINRIDGVSSVQLFGERTYSMRIWLDPNQLARRGLTPQDVVEAVASQNIQVPAGQLGQPPLPEAQDYQITLLAEGRLESAEEFSNIILRTGQDGSLIKIKDVGRVELGAQSYSSNFQLNGTDAVGMGILKRSDANSVQIASQVGQTMERLSQDFPPGLTYKIPYDTTNFIEASTREVIFTLLMAIGLVVLTIFIFLQNIPVTLIPTITIPVSLIGTFAFMRVFGFSINTLTLFGLTLATGLVVDDAIVVVEAVATYVQDRGMRPKQAATAAMGQIFGAIIGTSLVLIAVFLPVAFFPGISGQVYQQFALTIVFSVIISTFNALTLSPALSALIIRPQGDRRNLWGRFMNLLEGMIQQLRGFYQWILGGVIRIRYLILVFFFASIAATFWMFQVVPPGFVPTDDQGYIIAFVQNPVGSSLNYTQRVLEKATNFIRQTVPEAVDIVTVGGFSFSGASSNSGLIFTTLVPWSERSGPGQTAPEIVERLQGPLLGGISEGLVIPINPPPIEGVGNASGFDFQLQGVATNGFQELENVSRGIFGQGSQNPVLNVFPPSFSAGSPQLRIDVDRERSQLLGVLPTDIFNTLQIMLGSSYVNNFNLFAQNYRVYVQADQPYRLDPQDIDQLYVRSRTNPDSLIPLTNLVDVEPTAGPQVISHYNLFRSVQIQGQANPGFSSGQALEAMEQIAQQVIPAGMSYEWTGLSLEEVESGGLAPLIFGVGLIFAFLVLAGLYNNWVDPMIIMLTVPLAVLGALIFQQLRGLQNDIFCQVGLVMLIGLASKNAILVVEFANQLREQGQSILQAAVQAAQSRFRAILMTALSFVFGILPLVFATGAGAAARHSLGTAVFGGMLVATLLSLFFIPVLYIFIKQIEAFFRRGEEEEYDVPTLPPHLS